MFQIVSREGLSVHVASYDKKVPSLSDRKKVGGFFGPDTDSSALKLM